MNRSIPDTLQHPSHPGFLPQVESCLDLWLAEVDQAHRAAELEGVDDAVHYRVRVAVQLEPLDDRLVLVGFQPSLVAVEVRVL